MAMLKVGICDDNQAFLISCRRKLEQFFQNIEVDNKILEFSSKKELFDFLKGSELLNLLFLDIEMEEDNGIEIAKQIEFQGFLEPPEIVFVTNYPQYCSDVYRVNHSFFVLKSELERYLPEIISGYQKREQQKQKMILIQNLQKQSVVLKLSQIIYCERELRKTKIYYKDVVIEVKDSIAELEELLWKEGCPVCRCHNSFLVNMAKIEKLDVTEIQMIDKRRIPVSRAYRHKVQEKLAEWLTK